MSERYALLVLGGGPAGLAGARAFRAAGGAGAVAIVSDEHRMPYRRPPLTKELLRGEIEEAELPIEAEGWLHAHDVRLVFGRAVALDPDAATVTLSGGRELAYERCLLATGAEPKRLPIPGADDPAVRVLRTVDHLRELNARLGPGDPVTVIGSGFIGCEIAASLRVRGHPVTVVSDEPLPNANRLGEAAAAELADWLAADGVELRMGRAVDAIDRDGERLTVRAGTDRVSTALVVMASGVAPRVELAQAAGLALIGGAVAVDAAMRSSDQRILAAGDACLAENAAAGRRLRVEHWGEALIHGEIAGNTAAGVAAAWDGVPGFWSTIGARTLKYAAWGDGFDVDRLERVGANGGFVVRYGRGGELAGVLCHRADAEYDRVAEAIGRRAPWPT